MLKSKQKHRDQKQPIDSSFIKIQQKMALYLTATRFCVYSTNAIGKQCFRNPPNLYWKQVCDLKTSFFKRLQHNIISKGHKTSSKHTTIQWIIASGGILTTKLIFLPMKVAKCDLECTIFKAAQLLRSAAFYILLFCCCCIVFRFRQNCPRLVQIVSILI